MLDDILNIPHEFTYWEVYWGCVVILSIIYVLSIIIKKGTPDFLTDNGFFSDESFFFRIVSSYLWFTLYLSLFLALIAILPIRYAYDWNQDFEHKKGVIYKGAVEQLYDWCNAVINNVNKNNIYTCMTSKNARQNYLISSNAIQKEIETINQLYEYNFRKKNEIFNQIPKEYLSLAPSEDYKDKLSYTSSYFLSGTLEAYFDPEISSYMPRRLEDLERDHYNIKGLTMESYNHMQLSDFDKFLVDLNIIRAAAQQNSNSMEDAIKAKEVQRMIYTNDDDLLSDIEIYLQLKDDPIAMEYLVPNFSQIPEEVYQTKTNYWLSISYNFLMPHLLGKQNSYIALLCNDSDKLKFYSKNSKLSEEFPHSWWMPFMGGCEMDIAYLQERDKTTYRTSYWNIIKGFNIKAPARIVFDPFSKKFNSYQYKLRDIELTTIRKIKKVSENYKIQKFLKLILEDGK